MDAANQTMYRPVKVLLSGGVIEAVNDDPETAGQMRVALNNCVSADKDVRLQNEVISPQYRATLLDEEVISFWLSVSNLEQHQVPTFVAVQWAKRANGVGEWMALLERNTAHLKTTEAATVFCCA